MEIAVTGYSGFIGQHLVYALLKQGHIVYPIDRNFRSVKCDRVYHLACPSSTASINADPIKIMDTILDGTRRALNICPAALFINASSMGAENLEISPQGAYNIAKRCMETYVAMTSNHFLNYRIPSVYGMGAHSDSFVQRCVDGTAYPPSNPTQMHHIAHIDDVVDALVNLKPILVEDITLGEIYEYFGSGRRGIYRSTPSS